MTGSISDRTIDALNAIAKAIESVARAYADVGSILTVRETPQPEDAQIDAPVPAERSQGGAGGSRTLRAQIERVRAVATPLGVTPSDDSWWKGYEEAMRRVRVALDETNENEEAS